LFRKAEALLCGLPLRAHRGKYLYDLGLSRDRHPTSHFVQISRSKTAKTWRNNNLLGFVLENLIARKVQSM
jgi:hypothetical protein